MDRRQSHSVLRLRNILITLLVVIVAIGVLVAVGAYVLFGQGAGVEPPSLDYPTGVEKEEQIEYVMREHVIDEGGQPVHSFLLYVENEPQNVTIHKGVGTTGRNDVPVDEEYQYKVASITKMFVATVILQLMEEGELDLQDPAATYLREIDYLRYDELHVLDGEACSDEITIDQLLQHRTGLADIFIDTETRFYVNVLTHPRARYSPERIMDTFFKYGLNEEPHFKPGEGYYYSDINYVLLGLIIEQITGDSLPQQIRQRILVPLDMSDTYFEFYEPAQGDGKQIDTYLGRLNVTRDVYTSHEWGGGGLVSTTRDTATYIQALFDVELFESESTLQVMMDNSENEAEGKTYARGINVYPLGDDTYYGHGGFYGSLLVYNPEKGITFSAHVAQANLPYDAEALVEVLLEIVENP